MKQLRLITLASAVLLLASCSVPPALPMDNSTPMPITTATVGKSGNNPKSTENGELAIVEKMNIVFLESFPLQVHLVITGSLPDSCTSIQRHAVAFDENTFKIRIFTQKQEGLVCAQSLVPFEYIVPLDVFGLPAGDYSVTAHGNSTQFTFNQDNVPGSDGICTLCFPDPTPEDIE